MAVPAAALRASTTGTARAQDPTAPDNPAQGLRLELCGIPVDYLVEDDVLRGVRHRLEHPAAPPLALGSVNLDHIHHFGPRGRGRHDALGMRIPWLMLIDGAPVARRATLATGVDWPRLAGADLLPQILDLAQRTGARVGFLGGFEESVPALQACLAESWPDLLPAQFWTPPRSVILDDAASDELAADIAREGVDILVVGLGKPRQERWIERHGEQTGARVLAAFGAAADFLAGSARRAPVWMRRAGLEWSFRLVCEPRRLSRRYLVEGPAALWALRRATARVSHVAVTSGATRIERTERGVTEFGATVVHVDDGDGERAGLGRT